MNKFNQFQSVVGASLSEPHTSESICCTSFRKCKLTLLTRNTVHAEFKCRWNIEKITWSKYYSVYTLPCSSLQPYFCQSFTFTILGYKFCYPWIPTPILEELSSWHRNKKLLEIGDGPETRDRARHAAEISEQRSEKAKGERSC